GFFFDYIDDAINDDADLMQTIVEHDDLNLLGACAFGRGARLNQIAKLNERQDTIAIAHYVAAGGLFDLLAVEFLEPPSKRERHRDTFRGTCAAQQQRLTLVVGVVDQPLLLAAGAFARFDRDGCELGNAEHVKDERNASVAHDRRAGEDRHALEVFAERL